MKVTIIIINFNTTQLLIDCIHSIYAQTKSILFEIIVVDNASTDEFESINTIFPNLITIKLPTNIGFGQANNKGIAMAKGEYVFLLNSDTILLNNAIKNFADFMDNHKSQKIGAIGGQLLELDGITKNHSSSTFPSFKSEFKEEFNRISRAFFKKEIWSKPNEILLKDNQEYIEVDYVTGADLFMPLSVLKDIGAFDPQFFMYYEETDLQFRMQQAGYKRLIVANSKIVHLEGGSFDASKKISGKRLYMIEESKFKYFRKHKSPLHYYCFRLIYLFTSLPLFFKTAIPFGYRIRLLKLRINLRK